MKKKYEESSRYLFIQKFGKDISEFDTIKNATEALSDKTKQSYYKELSNFFIWLNESPDQVIANRKIQYKVDDETSDYYERKVRAYKKMLEESMTGRTIAGRIGRIQGFFANNSSKFRLELGVMKYDKARRVEKFSPDNTIAREVYSFADSARDRLIIAFAYQCGLAPVDISELQCSKIPTEPFKYFQGSRSKTGEIWHGVTTPEIVQEFAAYKKIRGEPVNGEPLFKGREGYLDSAGISQIITILIKKAGYGDVAGFKPTAFRDGLEDALIEAGIPDKVKEAMMGHAGGIEAQYGGHKQFVARIEEAMQKAYKYLVLTEVVTSNGKSAHKISELDDALIESQKRISALETTNESLTNRLTDTEAKIARLEVVNVPMISFYENYLGQLITARDKTIESIKANRPNIALARDEVKDANKGIEQLERALKGLRELSSKS